MKADTSNPVSKNLFPAPLAVIGIGCLYPKAGDLEDYWANIRDARDCITEVPPTHWDPKDYYDPNPKARDRVYAHRGGFLDPVQFNPMEFGVAPKDIEATDTTQLLGLIAAKQALIDAGYGPDRSYDREKTSVILGVTGALELVVPLGARLGQPIWRKALQEAGVDEQTVNDVVSRIAGSYVEWQENSFPGLLGNVTAGRIANRFDLGGANCVVDAACASSLAALELAALELACGRTDMVVTGGADTFNSEFMYTCFSKTPALSPTGEARPFEAEGDGTILGEGLGMLVIKRLKDAERDGDHIYAVIRGIGCSSDGKGNAVYAPSARGQVLAVRRACAEAGVEPETVELIEAHGTGTIVGDVVELDALHQVYGRAGGTRPWCALGSVKSQIGHTKAAAGAAGLIKAAMALKHKTLPPTIKVNTPLKPLGEPDSPFYLNTQMRPWLSSGAHPRRAAISSFGFGGSNFHIILEEYGDRKANIDWDGRVQIAAFSAETPERLVEKLVDLPGAPDDWSAWRAMALESRTTFNHKAPCRLLMVLDRDASDLNGLRNAAEKVIKGGPDFASSPEGIYYGAGDDPGKLALLFPGQGSQYTGMLREIACRFPMMFDLLASADYSIYSQEGGASEKRLVDFIYPKGVLTKEDAKRAEEELKDTRVAQPALGAAALGLYRVLEHFGLKGDLAAGHSYGELVALCVSGRYGEEDLHNLSRLRGSLMAGSNGSQGAMMAVKTGADRVSDLITASGLDDLAVANKNAPKQTVISGKAADIAKAARVFEEAGVPCVRLRVSNAFHSRLMASAQQPFKEALDQVRFGPTGIPAYSNSTGQPYPESEAESRELLAGQLTRPVEFIDEILNMHQAGVGTFLEVGPSANLTGLVNSILQGKSYHALAVDSSKGARSGLVDLARTLAHISALGYSLDLSRWDDDYKPSKDEKTGFTVPVCGANSFVKKEIPPRPAPKHEAKPLPVNPKPRKTAPTVEPALKPQSIVETGLSQERTTPSPSGSGLPAESGAVREALRMTRENINTLQQMQARTAELHQQFLAGQEIAQKSLQGLINQQQRLLEGNVAAERSPVESLPQPVVQPVRPARPIQPESLAPVQTPASDEARIMDLLIGVVSDQTGYPREMLAPDMKLDADLGVDSIKRVEILSALSEQLPGLSKASPEEIGVLETLGDMAGLIASHAGGTPGASPALPVAETAAPDEGRIMDLLIGVVSDQTGYPREMLAADMKLDADLGVDSIKRVEILSALSEQLPGLSKASPEEIGVLETLVDMAGLIASHAGGIAGPGIAEPVAEASALDEGRIMDLLIGVVSDQTGYPREMLAPDMKLDADLGVDSIKRVEILSALSEQLPGLSKASPEEIGVLETLGDMAGLIASHAGRSSGQHPAEPVAETAAPDEGRIKDLLIGIVSDQTGYPEEMLNPDMNLEADLGVDSIKKVEIFAALSEALPDLPEAGPEQLALLQTLEDVVDFLMSKPSGVRSLPDEKPIDPAVRTELFRVVQELTGFSGDDLSDNLRFEEDLGLDPIRRAELNRAAADALGLDPDHLDLMSAETLGDAARICSSLKPSSADPKIEEPVDRYLVEARPLSEHVSVRPFEPAAGSRILVTADRDGLSDLIAAELTARGFLTEVIGIDDWKPDTPADLTGLVLVGRGPETDQDFIFKSFELVQRALPGLKSRPQEMPALFASVTRMDGRFGFGVGDLDFNPEEAALTGLAKTIHREWTEGLVSALDIAESEPDLPAAARLAVDEMLTPGPLEVGVADGRRWTLGLRRDALPVGPGPNLLEPGDVVLISGGARGVTAQAALTLARKWRPVLVLLGRTPPPEVEPEFLAGITNEAGIKKALFKQAQPGTTPKDIEKAYRRLTAAREIRKNLDLLQKAGAEVDYIQADVTDADAVRSAVDEARRKYGPIRGLVHGAGVLADRLIEDKTAEQFAMVYSTKTDGLKALLGATIDDPLRFIALFSSSTGRFGRAGQADYAAANEVLNKTAQREAAKNPETRVVSFNWGPWAGGMVTPSLERVFNNEGLTLIPLDAGAEYMVEEIETPPGGPVEVVVLGPGSGKPEEQSHEADCAPNGETSIDIPLSLESAPVLKSHVLDGRAVVPMALMIEWMARAAIKDCPDRRFIGFERLAVHRRLTVSEGDLLDLRLTASAPQDGGRYRPVRLESASGSAVEVYAEFEAILREEAGLGPLSPPLEGMAPYPHNGRFYQDGRLFHGPDLHGLIKVEGCGPAGIKGLVSTGPAPDAWFEAPVGPGWLMDPLVLDSAFQMYILWCWEQHGRPALPISIGRFQQSMRGFPKTGQVRIVVRPQKTMGPKVDADIEIAAPDGAPIARLDNVICFESDQLIEEYKRNRLDAYRSEATPASHDVPGNKQDPAEC